MIKEKISLDFNFKKIDKKIGRKKKLFHRRNKKKRFNDQEEQKSLWKYELH